MTSQEQGAESGRQRTKEEEPNTNAVCARWRLRELKDKSNSRLPFSAP
jgi:hypothetical protein